MRPLAIVIWALAALSAHPTAALAQAVSYRIDSTSRFDVLTDKAGIFGAFGHRHRIRAERFEGVIVYDPGNIARSRVEITVPTAGLTVVREGADVEDGDEVEAEMKSSVLPPERYPTIGFRSRLVTRSALGLQVIGTLIMAGRERPLAVDVAIDVAGDTLRARGKFAVRQTDFGIEPYSGFGGTIKVADEIGFDVDVVAVREPVAGE